MSCLTSGLSQMCFSDCLKWQTCSYTPALFLLVDSFLIISAPQKWFWQRGLHVTVKPMCQINAHTCFFLIKTRAVPDVPSMQCLLIIFFPLSSLEITCCLHCWAVFGPLRVKVVSSWRGFVQLLLSQLQVGLDPAATFLRVQGRGRSWTLKCLFTNFSNCS